MNGHGRASIGPRTPKRLAGTALAVIATGIVASLYAANPWAADSGFVEVPDLSGMTIAQARAVLARSELRPRLVGQRGADSDPLLVVEQDPRAGSDVAEGSGVDLVVAPNGDSHASDVTNWEFHPPSREEILEALSMFSFAEVALLDIAAPPRRLLVWQATGHFHARTDYGQEREEVSLIRADAEAESALGAGVLIDFRDAEVALRRADGTVCWLEGGYSLCLTPGTKAYGRSLEWARP